MVFPAVQAFSLGGRQESPAVRQIHWLFFFRITALSVLLGIAFALQSPSRTPFALPARHIAYFIAGVYLFTIVSALLMGRVTNLQRYAFLQVLMDIVLAGVLIFFSGGSQSIFTLVFFFPIIAVGLMRLPSYRVVCILFTIATYGTVLLLEYAGIHPLAGNVSTTPATPLTDPTALLYHFAIPAITFFLVGFLSSLLAERIRSTEAALWETSHDLDRLSRLHRQIVDDINTGIITVDGDGRITSINRAAEQITGYRAYELMGMELAEFFPSLGANPPGAPRTSASLRRKDGDKIPIGFSVARLNLPEAEGEHRVYTFQDLSEIKKMEHQLRQAEKMASIGRMAAGIAHEFRNPLAAISGAAQMLQPASNLPQSERLLGIILRECDRLEKIITEFLQFSRPAAPEKEWFNLAALIDETVQVLQQAGSLQCEIRTEAPDDLDCHADRNQIRQVLVNLLDNACQAMGDAQGEVRISARETAGPPPGVTITVQDSGPGIDPAKASRLFEPFYTTRPNGTGLGLAIAWQIIDNHGGAITLGNHAGGGAEAVIVLPLPT